MIKISDQLVISFDTNEIITMSEHTSSIRTKVEPRIMQVLQILIKNSPEVVSREQLITEVWDNYGGADDALNQSISHLRKLLNDTNKEDRIIETVVKKGYRFTLETENLSKKVSTSPNKMALSKWWIFIVIITLIALVFLIFGLNTESAIAPRDI